MNRLGPVLLSALCLAALLSCTTAPEPTSEDVFASSDQTPRDTLENFRKSLREREWRYVHVLLSERARNCYSRDKLKTFLSRTIPGGLEQLRLRQWDVKDISPGSGQGEATLTLVHPRFPDYTQTYRMVREDDYWRIDWSMADVLNVPRSVEDCN